MLGVGDAGEGHLVFFPPFLKVLRLFRSDGDNFRVAVNELLMIMAQLRHMVAAEGSLKTSVEHQHYILLAFIVGEFNCAALGIIHAEIRSDFVWII